MLFFYIRHGDPIYNPESLTPLGHRQAEAVGRRLARYGLDKIFVSSSNRAMLTAQPACEMLKMDRTILDWCNEAHAWAELAFPDEDGKTRWVCEQERFRKLFVSPEMYALGEEWPAHPALANTTVGAGIARIRRETDALLAQLGYTHDRARRLYHCEHENHSRVALFAHQGFGWAFMSALLDIPYPLYSTHFDTGHSGMTVIEFSPEPGDCVPRVLQLANDSHIYADGLPTNYQNRVRF